MPNVSVKSFHALYVPCSRFGEVLNSLQRVLHIRRSGRSRSYGFTQGNCGRLHLDLYSIGIGFSHLLRYAFVSDMTDR